MKRKLLDIKNLILSIKLVGVSVVSGLVWALPSLLVRYIVMNLNMPVIGLIGALVSIAGYMYTFGFLANKLFNINA